MDEVAFDKLEMIFKEARDLRAIERQDFLDEACNGNVRLRKEVDALLQADDSPHPALTAAIDAACDDGRSFIQANRNETAEPPSEIGGYRILDVLGEGGMGIVYRAQQENPRREVALKVIRQGLFSSSHLQRFKHEAEVLGRLQHPGIAQIFESGSMQAGYDHQPFFVMELIEGKPLDAYLHDSGLSVKSRLQLFTLICEAVQHAHIKGVVHRDLKPANILITETGQPRILDFGVARVTDADMLERTLATNVGQLIGTVPYMSPEQISGQPDAIDARSDVYALGVILFEMLADRLPLQLQHKSIAESARIIQEEDPCRLSSIDRSLRGDLETIVGKALEKEQDRRYQSAAELANDVGRFLRNQPILARPTSAWYQFQKFARRNRALVTGVTAAIVFLMIAVAGTTYGLVQSQKSANRRANVNAFMSEILTSVNPSREGAEARLIDAIDLAAERVGERFADDPLQEAEVHRLLAEMYLNQARNYEGIEQLDMAIDLLTPIHGAEDEEVLTMRMMRLNPSMHLDRHRDVWEEANELADIFRDRHGPDHPRTFGAELFIARVELRKGDYDTTIATFEEMVKRSKHIFGHDAPETIDIMADLGRIYRISAMQMFGEKRIRRIQQSLDILEQAVARTRKMTPQNVAETGPNYLLYAETLTEAEQFELAADLCEQIVRYGSGRLDDSHWMRIRALTQQSKALAGMNRYEEAADCVIDAIESYDTFDRNVISLTQYKAEALPILLMAGHNELGQNYAHELALQLNEVGHITESTVARMDIFQFLFLIGQRQYEEAKVVQAQRLSDPTIQLSANSLALQFLGQIRLAIQENELEQANDLVDSIATIILPGGGPVAQTDQRLATSAQFVLRELADICEILGRTEESKAWQQRFANAQGLGEQREAME